MIVPKIKMEKSLKYIELMGKAQMVNIEIETIGKRIAQRYFHYNLLLLLLFCYQDVEMILKLMIMFY